MFKPFNLLRKPNDASVRQRAVVGDTIIAEATNTVGLEGNTYFPPDAVNWDRLEPSDRTSICPWKGVANYYDVIVDGERLPAAAWTYRTPSPAAEHIAGHVAFWHGVCVNKDE